MYIGSCGVPPYEVREGSGIREGYQLRVYRIGDKEKVIFSGVDVSGAMKFFKGGDKDGFVIIKRTGGSFRASLGDTKYAPPSYIIGRVVFEKSQGNYRQGRFSQSCEIVYVKANMKKAKEEALARFEKLTKGKEDKANERH